MPQAESVAIPKRLPLVIQPENRAEDTLKDAKLVNGYMEVNESQKETWIYKRPGLLQTGATQTGTGRGAYNWLGDVYMIFGATMYKNGVALAGTLDTTNGLYRFSSCLGATPRLQFGNGTKTYNYDSGAGIVQIPAGVNNFPTTCVKGIGYLDGTVYVADANASIRGCTALNDPTDWSDVLNRLTAQIEPDGGVALAKQLVYILMLGQWSTEVFYDAANTTASPLSPVQGAKINYGCVTADSVADIDGTLLWIATNRGAAPQIIMLENLKPSIISTKAIERLLGEADFTHVWAFGIKYEGHRFYVLTLKDENLTLVFDLTDKSWAQWTDVNGNYWPIVASTYNSTLGRVLQHESNGKMYLFDAEYVNDDSSIITVDLYTPNFDGGVRRRKQLNVMEFIGDQTEGSILKVRCNDSDYAADKWTNFRTVDLGQKKPTLINNGSFMRRAYHFRHQSNTRMRLQAVELQLDIGTL